MDIPGLAEAIQDPYVSGRAEEEADKLLEELKKSVRVEIRDVGPLRKELRVSVPRKVIDEFLARNIDELRQDAIVPGFRKGHAPRKLVEKRFGGEVRDSLKSMVLGQSYFAALENHKLQALGDPVIQIESDGQTKFVGVEEALNRLTLPQDGDFDYVCEIEVRPEFELPELKGIEVSRPDVKIGPADVDEFILNQRKLRGRIEPLVGQPAQPDDLLIADVVLTCDGQEIKREENLEIGVRPQRVDGVPLEKLGEALTGVQTGQTVCVDCELPDDYERQDLRGKPARFAFTVHEIKRLVPAPLEDLLKAGGYATEAELKDFVRQSLELELEQMIQNGLRSQILAYLLDKTQFDLPEKLSARQTDRAVARQIIELQRRGVPFADIEARIDELRTVARRDAVVQLKLQFILDRVAENLQVKVTDEEVNTAIAQIARRYNRRFDRIRDELQQQGTLALLADQIRHDKCVDLLLRDARLVERPSEAEKPEAEAAARKSPRPSARKPRTEPKQTEPKQTEPHETETPKTAARQAKPHRAARGTGKAGGGEAKPATPRRKPRTKKD